MNLYKQCFSICVVVTLLLSCSPAKPPEQSAGHLDKDQVKDIPAPIPAPVNRTVLLPEPEQRPPLETYTVVVNDVPVRELLFSMARDAKLNLDIGQDISGNVTLNAIDQTLPQILERLTRQADIRYELDGDNLRVSADKPYVRNYKIDYLNMARSSEGLVSVATSVGKTGAAAGQGNTSTAGNDSTTVMNMKSDNQLWATLSRNLALILGELPQQSEAGDIPDSTRVIVNRESGVIAVNATYKQHQLVQAFIDDVLNSAKRQVLIEATIAEITLSDRYQSGVDWSLVASDPADGVSFNTNLAGTNLSQPPFSLLTIANTVSGDALNLTLKALEEFGDVQVLSSPKVIALNNQTAMLKVVDNLVYFEVEVQTTAASSTSASVTTIETEINTVPVGFVMSVTPFINEQEVVTLNVRPTISRVIDSVADPNPALANAGVVSEIPVVQVREIESVLKVNSGDTAIIGGLMQDVKNKRNTGVPVLSSIPWIGKLFSYEDDQREKSELVIFIRPVVVRQASLSGDLRDYRKFLPETESTQ